MASAAVPLHSCSDAPSNMDIPEPDFDVDLAVGSEGDDIVSSLTESPLIPSGSIWSSPFARGPPDAAKDVLCTGSEEVPGSCPVEIPFTRARCDGGRLGFLGKQP